MQNQENGKFSHPVLTEEYLAQFPADQIEIPHPTMPGAICIRPGPSPYSPGMKGLHEVMREVGRKLREKKRAKEAAEAAAALRQA